MNFNPITDFLSSKAIPLLAGALVLSATGNIAQFYYGNHQVAKKVECVTAVKQATENAKKDKAIVEVRQKKAVNESTNRINTRIADVTRRLHDRPGGVVNPSPAAGSPGPAEREGGATVVLPLATYRDDQRICLANTVKAEEWQTFYSAVKTIREEQNDTPNP